MNVGQNVNSMNMTYEQFMDQVRIRREQEMMAARQALQNAGADSQSGRGREILNSMESIIRELELAENQLLVQMDAQQRQLKRVRDRIRETEASIQNYVLKGGTLPH
ncbi:hypothetical protein [Paenibacillus beijingensis]|uniref:Uncharacterized protein n=1 Tax=Paenibacillus beijingensis TaxID=1126833 RepID=A0A0D5NNI2_9BACL|nr:hypothetical protein [Paenibacillus beijingensis]AJY76700.1 hypothetical protein VN24_21655 [Paenibacillus beijingensis]